LAAIDIAKSEIPEIKLRFVNVSSLTARGFGQGKNHIDEAEFNNQFTPDKPVIFNFHGYPETLKSILFNYATDANRFDIRGYIECGSTTTPFDMHVRNKTSRYHLVMAVFEKLAVTGKIPFEEARRLINKYQQKIDINTDYIKEYGVDMPEIEDWVWSKEKPKDLI